MKIILKEDVHGLGYKDDILTVKDGYGRNFLIPTGKAILATPSAEKVLAEDTEIVGYEGKEFETAVKIIPGYTLVMEVVSDDDQDGNPDENQENVKWFLNKYPEFTLKEERLFVQGVDNCDGFYFAVLVKG